MGSEQHAKMLSPHWEIIRWNLLGNMFTLSLCNMLACIFELTNCRCSQCRQISKSTSAATPFFDWLVEKAEVWGGRILPPATKSLFFFFATFPYNNRYWQDGFGTWQSCSPSYIQPQHPLWRQLWPEPRRGIKWWWWVCASDLMCLHISCHSLLCLSFHSILKLFQHILFLDPKKSMTF